MSMVCQRLFAAGVLFICLPSYFVVGGPAAKEVALPDGCFVDEVTDGKLFYCDDGPPYPKPLRLREALLAIHRLGEELVEVMIWSCANGPMKLNQSSFENNINLRSIMIWRCFIVDIGPRTFEKLNKLESLDLQENQITGVLTEQTFEGLANLLYLDLSLNKISGIKRKAFDGLTSLSEIYLTANDIHDFSEDMIINLGNVVVLDLSENSILEIGSKMFFNMKRIENLNIGHQNDKWYFDKPWLRAFDMLHGLTHLKVLNLAGFSMSYMYSEIREKNVSLFFKDQHDTLTELDLTSTQFTNNMLAMLKNLKRLEKLTLRGNYIGFILGDSLPKPVHTWSGILPKLDLSSNKIMYIDEGALSGFFDGDVEITDNSFYCDCKLLGFTKWLLEHHLSPWPLSDEAPLCSGPVSMYGSKVVDYNPYWWQCSPYIPLIALVAIIGFAVLLALVTLVVSCNRVNFKHWLLERRAAAVAEVEAEQQAAATERSALIPPDRLCGISSLPKGMTGAYILYNMDEEDVKRWVDHHIEEKLYRHPMKITLQWAAGPSFMPLWKQVKDYGFGVRHFLVVVTEELLRDHWPQMSENGGVENLSKFVLVLWGKKKKDLPADLRRLRCPCIEWPITAPKFSSLQREREQFWKRVRLAVKDLSD